MTIAAAIDIGSNSIHLLVAALDIDRSIEPHLDLSAQLDLGLVVEQHGRLGAGARRAAAEIVSDYAQQARAGGADRTLLMGTQPVRRAADRSLLRREIRALCGLELVVLSHEQEATLTLLGVTGGRPVERPLVVIDIGGGSTEVILIAPDADPVVGALPVGSARLAAAVLRHDPPIAAEIAELRRAATGLAASLPTGAPERGIVSGGSGTNVSRLLGRERTTAVDRASLEAGLARITQARAGDIALATGLTERRVRQLAAGIALVSALMDRYGLQVTDVSDAGLREGALLAATSPDADVLAWPPG